ncbi:MAG: MFS transporter [Candidatus Aenigmarchaeota archaeon]|nr:MFS transporter [Candidatus Aenigmarchaeota archaeon]
MEISEKKRLESNIWKLYVFQIFRNLSFFLPIIVLFWQDNGLNMTEIMLLQSIYAISIVLLEIPTGYFADLFGRKKSLVYSGFFLFFAIITYGIGGNFYHFLIAEILWAFGNSLISGSDSALIYDSLKELKREKEYKKIWGHSVFLFMIAIAAASIIGGFIGEINFRWTFYVMLPFLVLLIPLSLSMHEPKRHKLIFQRGYFWELLRILKYSLLQNKKLRWIMLYAGIVYAFNQAALWLYQPYFSLSGLDIAHFGFVFASFQIVAAITSKYSYKIERKLGEKYSLIMLIVLVGISYLLMSSFVYLFSFTFAFLHQFVRGFSKVVISDYINKLTKSENRATILSAKNMVGHLIYSAIIPFVGWIVDIYSLLQALTVLGITTLVIGSIMLLVLYKSKVI